MAEKKITDTYFALNGDKVKISKTVAIKGCDIVSRERILSVSEDSGIVQIDFWPVEKSVKDKVLETFGIEYKNVADDYILWVESEKITVYSNTANGFRYAACAIEKHYEDGGIAKGVLYNVPLCEFRAVKIYIPSRENIAFFKKFIDMCMWYGYNTLVLEIGGAMEYKKHPEINDGWIEYCNIFRDSKPQDVQKSMPWNKNSIHCENGGGSYLTQEELKDLIDYCADRGIEIIPEVPCLSHCDYLLFNHKELAENVLDPIPDAYCPSNPESYKLLFDILDEIIDLFQPKTIHIGHDEWYTFGICDKCKGKEPAQLFADDINKIHGYLKGKYIDTMIWGDKLLNATDDVTGSTHGGARVVTRRVPGNRTVSYLGKKYPVYEEYWGPDADTVDGGVLFEVPETYHAIGMLPKDLKIMNWYHNIYREGDNVFHKNGLWQVYGNFDFGGLAFQNWFERIHSGVHGISISNWSFMDQNHMQRNGVLFGIVYASMMIWNKEFSEEQKNENTIKAVNDLFLYNNKEVLNGSYIEIVHGTDIKIPHDLFVDGNRINNDDYRLGFYEITYQDGTKDIYPILWGYNIGYKDFNLNQNGDSDLLKENISIILEPTYTCDYVLENNEVYYKVIIPVEKNVEKVESNILEKYKENIFIKSIVKNYI